MSVKFVENSEYCWKWTNCNVIMVYTAVSLRQTEKVGSGNSFNQCYFSFAVSLYCYFTI